MMRTSVDLAAQKVINGERVSRDEAVELYHRASTHHLGLLANVIRRRKHPEGVVTYIVDRNVNYTNICVAKCKFCAFYREVGAGDGYVLGFDEICAKIDETIELGGVQLNLNGATASAAAEEMGARIREVAPDLELRGFLIEEMAAPGVEMILGLSRDPVFGMVLTVGLGGIMAELLEDVAHRLLPVSEDEALSMLRQLRGWPLLDGHRGRAPADVSALVRTITTLSDLGMGSDGRIETLDLNPVIVGEAGQGATVCDALVVLSR